ncbi:ferredoxin-type protein NapG [Dinoroseobacter shibae DFL 12 = DSM 16493]|jgi:ferredoxin-type protein NapG|uniref:Ferredoxin-type protein NapG n=1 Tax=Dinoroseobacter shibae (strain DSM 16493 / NCIMB 14021 / DFL 12) TaxID=398580 RepID=A8LLY8_DINSH|nr:ferredoxin-type protein NapG [Dinoroseobacter shibae]ABV94897.1 ferredoxin-type protein NapG [Dinoroseobacter shibae DFL 12 = DSM 16493]URF46318.1 ferredoxin-type protein NapG [Dinoroseobacter shibae]URF50624.1 ferredoxin-type protein NapG [Dinoroseobacter shibae]
MSVPDISPDRRRFLKDAARMAGGCMLAGGGLAWLARDARALPAQALRPPGALAEAAFLSACIRCGLCVRECPYDTLVLAELGSDGPATGTPYFIARDVPCEMCEDIPCVAACPTGALDPALDDIDDARMGTAVLVDQENCLNFQGLRCDVCYRVCPVIDEAITLDVSHNTRSGHHAMFIPTVHADHCTGCGMCEKSCVLPEAAIKVLPLRMARATPAEHYRKGWEEKDAKGGPVVEGIIDLPDRLPGPGTDNLATPGGFEPAFKLPGTGQ